MCICVTTIWADSVYMTVFLLPRNVSVESLAKFDQRIRGLSLHLDPDHIDPTKLIFTLSTQYDFKTGFYDRRHCLICWSAEAK